MYKEELDKIEKAFLIEGRLMDRTRKKEVVRVRQVVQYYMNNNIKMFTTEIGRFFNQDHSTVVHSIKATKSDLEYSEVTRHILRVVTEIFESGSTNATPLNLKESLKTINYNLQDGYTY